MNRHERHGITRFLWSFVGSSLFLTLTLSILFFVPVKAEASLLDVLPVNIASDEPVQTFTDSISDAPKEAASIAPSEAIVDPSTIQLPLTEAPLSVISSGESEPQANTSNDRAVSSATDSDSLRVPSLQVNLPVVSIQTPALSIPDKPLSSVKLPKVEIYTPVAKVDSLKIDTPIVKVEAPPDAESVNSDNETKLLQNTESPTISLDQSLIPTAAFEEKVEPVPVPVPELPLNPPDLPLTTVDQQVKLPQQKFESFVVKKDQPLQPAPISEPLQRTHIQLWALSPTNPIPVPQQGGLGHSGSAAGFSLTAVWSYESINPIWQQSLLVEHRLFVTDQWSHAPPGQPPKHSIISRTDFETPKFEK